MNARDEDEIRKSSTMNSMYIGSTISKPNVESIINAVATILHSQMLEVSRIFQNYVHFYPLFLLTLFFINSRIKTKARKSNKKVHFSTFLKRNISWKNLKLSTIKE